MWNLLNRRRDECERLQDLLESSAAGVLVEVSKNSLRVCRRMGAPTCRLRELPRSPARSVGDPGTVIARRRTRRGWRAVVREARTVCDRSARTEVAFPLSAWSMVPRFASRLAWASALYLWLEAPGCIKGPRQVRSGSRLPRPHRISL